ncbi:hypothetical protein LshimejAT787_0804730 [Lyophyllum shimeji]|uniref:Uncharacterized protein n=1 Tax=Lyophyllum shimeji TaxID=47721 RepID=A0A9P3UPT6_LYOSH|nr:hypothetical protein LshimejAT787_0804730 [Lyophyllum shimeji]
MPAPALRIPHANSGTGAQHRLAAGMLPIPSTSVDTSRTLLSTLRESANVSRPLKSVTGGGLAVWNAAERARSLKDKAGATMDCCDEILNGLVEPIPDSSDIPSGMDRASTSSRRRAFWMMCSEPWNPSRNVECSLRGSRTSTATRMRLMPALSARTKPAGISSSSRLYALNGNFRRCVICVTSRRSS